MSGERENTLENLAREAIRLGAGALEIESKEGCDNVFAYRGRVGVGIASFRRSSREALTLREELYDVAKRKRRLEAGGCEYELRCRVFDSFGDDAFRVKLRKVATDAQPEPGRTRRKR